jgi:hypothetical protein
MNALPNQQSAAADTDSPEPSPAPVPAAGKEQEPPARGETAGLREVGQDIDLPKEVGAAGVRVTPTTVALPQSVSQQGVKPVGSVAAASAGAPVSLPLSDDQIAQGLKQGVASSWRWVAEWCVRRLKQAHTALKRIHGKFVRVGA